MTYIIIGMFGIVIILLIVVILRTKRSNNNDIVERLGKLETNLTKDILEFKYGLSKDISSDFKVLNDDIRNSLIRNGLIRKLWTINWGNIRVIDFIGINLLIYYRSRSKSVSIANNFFVHLLFS